MKKILFLFIFFATSLFSNEYLIFKDNSKSNDINYILKNHELIFKKDKDSHKGFANSNIWLKINLENKEQNQISKYIIFKYQFLKNVTLYEQTQNSIKTYENGLNISPINRDVKRNHIVFKLDLKANSNKTVYIKIDTDFSANIDYIIADIAGLYEYKIDINTTFTILITSMVLLFIYNLFIYITLKDKAYRIYLIYISLVLLILLASFNKLSLIRFDYLNPIDVVYILGVFMIASILLLFKEIFKETINEKLNKIINFLVVFTLLHLVLLVFGSATATKIYTYSGTGGMVILGMLYILWNVYKKNHPLVKLVAFGWFAWIVFSSLYLFHLVGLISDEYQYMYTYGSIIEGLFFSFALAKRISLETKKRLETEKKLISKDEQIKAHQKLAQVGQMIGNISHQWKQPLNTIHVIASGAIFQKQMGVFDEDYHMKELESVLSVSSYLSQTVDTFRRYLKEDKVLEEIIIQDRIKLALEISSLKLTNSEIEVKADFEKLEPIKYTLIKGELIEVLINLINNAKDAIFEVNPQEKWIKIDLTKYDKEIIISVEDNAGGIPEHVLPNIFDEYFTTKDIFQGTGIGLYMSKKIVEESLKGQLTVENSENGAVFSIHLPIN